jgi:phosphoglycolate phosphatase/putative hydrolase of the HAD superfamily
MKSKPAREMLELAAQTANATFGECISIGDRFDIDLSLALESGMGGILVSGVEEIYELPALLGEKASASSSGSDLLLETLVAFLSA